MMCRNSHIELQILVWKPSDDVLTVPMRRSVDNFAQGFFLFHLWQTCLSRTLQSMTGSRHTVHGGTVCRRGARQVLSRPRGDTGNILLANRGYRVPEHRPAGEAYFIAATRNQDHAPHCRRRWQRATLADILEGLRRKPGASVPWGHTPAGRATSHNDGRPLVAPRPPSTLLSANVVSKDLPGPTSAGAALWAGAAAVAAPAHLGQLELARLDLGQQAAQLVVQL